MSPTTESPAVNKPGGRVPRTHSKFKKLGYLNFDTYQYGKIKPCQISELVSGDKKFSCYSGSDVRSFNLKAPLMQDVHMYKTHVSVPLQCILPLNWWRWKDNPDKGQDCPDDCGTGVENFPFKIAKIFQYLCSRFDAVYSAVPQDTKAIFDAFVHLYQFGSLFYSNGSLISSLGYHMGACAYILVDNPDTGVSGERWSFDRFFEYYIEEFHRLLPGGFSYVMPSGSNIYYVGDQYPGDASNYPELYMSWREFFADRIYEDSVSIVGVNGSIDWDNFPDITTDGFMLWQIAQPNTVFNLARVATYQLAIAEFFTNSKVDYIFSAELYRELVRDIMKKVIVTSIGSSYDTLAFFTQNGVSYEYDALSAHMFDLVFRSVITDGNGMDVDTWNYFLTLFSFRNSLKYMDYFVGSRTRPLAVGDVNIEGVVVGNQAEINVIDVVQKGWRAKLLQAVARFSQKPDDYSKGIDGTRMTYDYHDPLFLGQTQDTIYSVETDNTGAAQLSEGMTTTANFRMNSNRFAFTFNADRPVYIISLVHFDVDRAYCRSIDRQFFILDRFDMFNPFAQFIGDQPIYRAELEASSDYTPFSYTSRHMEYKLRYNIAQGGFVEFLPGWCFLADKDSPTVLKPRYIRSHPTELDRFYNVLTHYTPAGYFHFVIKSNNNISAVRPMAFNPVISF